MNTKQHYLYNTVSWIVKNTVSAAGWLYTLKCCSL